MGGTLNSRPKERQQPTAAPARIGLGRHLSLQDKAFPMWLCFGLLSAAVFGFYDIGKKASVHGNAVLPVLFLSTVAGAVAVLPLIVLWLLCPGWCQAHDLLLWPLPPGGLIAILVKSAIITIAWTGSYFAIKHLPISLAAPVRSMGPVFTVLGAVLLLGERPSIWQGVGLLLALLGYFDLTQVGRREGVWLHRNVWAWLMLSTTVLTTASAMLDKVVLEKNGLVGMNAAQLQVGFAGCLVPMTGLLVLTLWMPQRARSTPFRWNWAIAGTGSLLVLADLTWFLALRQEGALLSVLSALRRASVVVPLLLGGHLFQESSLGRKVISVGFILAGAVAMVCG